MTCRKSQHSTVKKFGYNRNKTRRYRCTSCSATFSDAAPASFLTGHTTSKDKGTQAIALMLEDVHQTLRVTPAMEAGLTDHVWTIAELLGAA